MSNQRYVGARPASNDSTVDKAYVDGKVSDRALDAQVMHNINNETIDGVKSFIKSPVVPTPVNNTDAANKAYVDSKVGSGKSWTITSVNNTNASSIGTTAEVAPPSTQFTYLGTRTEYLINVQGSGGFGSRWKNGNTATVSTNPWGIQFRATKTRYVELMVAPVNADASIRISIDGVEESAIPLTFPSMPLNVFSTIKIDLGTTVRPNGAVIKLNFASNMLFGRLWIESTGNVSPVAEHGRRILFHGDSLTQGESQNTGSDLGSYVGYMDRYLKSNDIWNSGVRGTGPNQTSTNGGNYKTRATTDVVPAKPDIVIVSGFFNDRSAGRTPAQVGADFATTINNINTLSIKPIIIATGSPDPTGGSNATEWANFDNAIQAAVGPLGVCYVSQSTGKITWSDGTTATTQGPWITPAITSWFLGNDGLHPTDIGHQYLASRMAEAINIVLNQINTKVTNFGTQRLTLWKGTSAEYSAIANKDSNTVYIVQ
jgi:lysophospholipase L1-like esterase